MGKYDLEPGMREGAQVYADNALAYASKHYQLILQQCNSIEKLSDDDETIEFAKYIRKLAGESMLSSTVHHQLLQSAITTAHECLCKYAESNGTKKFALSHGIHGTAFSRHKEFSEKFGTIDIGGITSSMKWARINSLQKEEVRHSMNMMRMCAAHILSTYFISYGWMLGSGNMWRNQFMIDVSSSNANTAIDAAKIVFSDLPGHGSEALKHARAIIERNDIEDFVPAATAKTEKRSSL